MAVRLSELDARVLARYVARPSPIGHADRVARTLYDRGVLHQQACPEDIHGSRDSLTRLYSPHVIPLTNGYVPLDAVLGEKRATITLDAHRCALWRTVAQGMHIPIDPKNHAVLPERESRHRHKPRELNVAAHNPHLPDAIVEYLQKEHDMMIEDEERKLKQEQLQLAEERLRRELELEDATAVADTDECE